MAKEPTTQVAFRLPDGLIARLDRHVERVAKEHPGLDLSRADAVRSLLTRALGRALDGGHLGSKHTGRGALGTGGVRIAAGTTGLA